MKTTPRRMCVACRGLFDKKDLLRVVKTPEGDVVLDRTGKKSGRGAYVCDNEECIKRCVKGKLLNKTFKTFLSEEVYEKLLADYDATKR